MFIGEVSKKTGFSIDTIRWYEKIGLIKLDKKSRGENNYRIYDDAIVQRLVSIKQLKTFGFTLKEIEDLLIMDAIDSFNCESVTDLIDSKIDLINIKIAELISIKNKLENAKLDCNGNCKEILV